MEDVTPYEVEMEAPPSESVVDPELEQDIATMMGLKDPGQLRKLLKELIKSFCFQADEYSLNPDMEPLFSTYMEEDMEVYEVAFAIVGNDDDLDYSIVYKTSDYKSFETIVYRATLLELIELSETGDEVEGYFAGEVRFEDNFFQE